MAIKGLGFKIDAVAPHSENTLLSQDVIETFKKLYKAVVVLFDSDQAGIKAMKEYEETYGVPFCYLPLEKDISDIVRHHGKDTALRELSPKLDRAIEKYLQKN
jgi:DNA primase